MLQEISEVHTACHELVMLVVDSMVVGVKFVAVDITAKLMEPAVWTGIGGDIWPRALVILVRAGLELACHFLPNTYVFWCHYVELMLVICVVLMGTVRLVSDRWVT